VVLYINTHMNGPNVRRVWTIVVAAQCYSALAAVILPSFQVLEMMLKANIVQLQRCILSKDHCFKVCSMGDHPLYGGLSRCSITGSPTKSSLAGGIFPGVIRKLLQMSPRRFLTRESFPPANVYAPYEEFPIIENSPRS